LRFRYSSKFSSSTSSIGLSWHDDSLAPPAATPGGVLFELADDATAARLLRDAVTAGVPVLSFAPATGLLEQAYLALDEERT